MKKTLHSDKQLITGLEYPRPRWRYFILFQSWRQFESWLIIFLLSTIILYLIAKTIDPTTIPIEGLAIGTGIGSLFAVFSVIPAQFTVLNYSASHSKSLLSQIEYFGYIKHSESGGIVTFRQNLPRLLRWDEGNIALHTEIGTIKVTGPVCILKAIQRNLTKNIGKTQ